MTRHDDAGRARRLFKRAGLVVLAAASLSLASAISYRVVRVTKAAAAVPVYPALRESGGHTRYWPHLISWDDRSSARSDRVFAVGPDADLMAVARHANERLAAQGWYLVTPESLTHVNNPQVVVWQRDPDERLDLVQLWPLSGMSRAQRLYGGMFPPEFLDERLVIGWTWSLGGPRSARPQPTGRPIVRPAPMPPPPTVDR